MEKCRTIRNSLRKIDKELKTSKNDNDVDHNVIHKKLMQSKEDLTVQTEKLDRNGFPPNVKEYVESMKNLEVAEDSFFLKYRELCTQCKEERFLDELTEQNDLEYKSLRRFQDLLFRKELDIIGKEDKTLEKTLTYYIQCRETIMTTLEKNIFDYDPKIPEEVDPEYRSNLQLFLKKLQYFSEIQNHFTLVKSESASSNAPTDNAVNAQRPSSMALGGTSQALGSRSIGVSEDFATKTPGTGTLGFGNKETLTSSLNTLTLEKQQLERFLGKKANEGSNELYKKKITALIEYAIAVSKVKEEIWKNGVSEAKMLISLFSGFGKEKKALVYAGDRLKEYKIRYEDLSNVKERKEDYKKFEDYFRQQKSAPNKNFPSPNIYSEIINITRAETKILTSGGFADISRVQAQGFLFLVEKFGGFDIFNLEIEFSGKVTSKDKLLIKKTAKKISKIN